MLNTALEVIGAVFVAGGGGAAVVFLMFRAFGSEWLRHIFERDLEKFRHEQQLALEQTRSAIQASLDRQIRLHKTEYEVLPEAWARMKRAHDSVSVTLHPFQRYTDVGRMPDDVLEEYLSTSPFSATERASIVTAKDRQDRYSFLRNAYRLGEARQKTSALYEYITENALFFRPKIEKALLDQVDLMHKALIEAEVLKDKRFGKEHNAYDTFVARFPELESLIRKEAQQVLWFEEPEVSE